MGPGNPILRTHIFPQSTYSLGGESLATFFLSHRRHMFITVVPALACSHNPGLGFHEFNAQRNWSWPLSWLLHLGYAATRWQ